MGTFTGKHNKIYVDCLRDRSELTCMINAKFHYPKQFKVLDNFEIRYAAKGSFKSLRKEPTYDKKRKKISR